jgi:hypothetical protein
MMKQATETYVAEVLALQGVMASEDAAKAIAPALSAQLATAAAAYAALAFEAEPSGFAAAVAREKA